MVMNTGAEPYHPVDALAQPVLARRMFDFVRCNGAIIDGDPGWARFSAIAVLEGCSEELNGRDCYNPEASVAPPEEDWMSFGLELEPRRS